MEAIKKLRDKNIFGEDTIVESVVKKSLWGSPVFKKAFLNQISDVYIAFHKDAPKSKEYAEKIDAALHAMRIKNNRAVD